MHIKEIAIRNFRILSDSKLDLDKKPCLMIGRNNAGKTSFMVLFEKFMRDQRFGFDDFPLRIREKILNMDETTDETELAIQLMLTIHYEPNDNLNSLSAFIVDLEPGRSEVYLMFECGIDKKNLLKAADRAEGITRKAFIRKNLPVYLKTRIYTFENPDIPRNSRHLMVEKTHADVMNLIDFEIIHAKRSVASSEERHGRKVLSQLTTSYFNSENERDADKFAQINNLIERTDKQLDDKYRRFFADFLKSAKDFLDIETLNVRSNLSAKEILENASAVVYGDQDGQLPEYQNGLGHVNILYLLLSIEIKKRNFKANRKDIRLLFIEEPEAHTHPQLQYNFARKIKDLVGERQKIQTIITTHSPHIVSSHPFEHLRYMAVEQDGEGFRNVRIKNFHSELEKVYEKKEEFKFLKQYLTIESSELFFVDKAVFIEGTSEALLLPYFIARFDEEQQKKIAASKDEAAQQAYVPLAAQNIAVVQAGANAKAFRHFVEFLGIPTLVITDIDTVKPKEKKKKDDPDEEENGKSGGYHECKVSHEKACSTSNATLKYYFDVPKEKIGSDVYKAWFKGLLDHTLTSVAGNVHVSYQCEENGFRARSFEDAFINVNLDRIHANWKNISGLKKKKVFDTYYNSDPHAAPNVEDIYDLTEEILGGKSGLAASLLYLSYAKGVRWETPLYIKEGLEWLQEQTH